MPSEHTAEDNFQEFRILSASSSSDNSIFISSRLDKKTGERVVLWKDIQNEVDDARRIRNGKKSVSFMTDDDFNELDPKRILYHPGTVLDVIVTDREEKATYNTSMPLRTSSVQASAQCYPNTVSKDLARQENCGSAEFASVVHHVSNLSMATADAVNRSLIVQSAILDNEQTSLQECSFPDERLERMEMTGIQEGDLFQVHTLHLLQQMLDKQQQTLNRQVILETRVQALMTQNYELHEYPIPRL
ncbi:hypothetical protein BGX34_003101, partial [Mortierella sp. NVP85]